MDVVTKQRKWYEDYLYRHMREHEIESLSGPLTKIRIKPLPPIVEVDAVDIPDEYARVVPEQRHPDKKSIADALKNGIKLDFARMIVGRTKLEIK